MSASHCPGQDRRYWTPEDITLVSCPACGAEVELFKDEGKRRCAGCGTLVKNPRVLLGCASWCAFAEDCVGTGVTVDDAAGPVERVIGLLKEALTLDSRAAALLFRIEEAAEASSSLQDFPPLLVKITAVMVTAFEEAERALSEAQAEAGEDLGEPKLRSFILKSVLGRAEIPEDLRKPVADAVEHLILGSRTAGGVDGQGRIEAPPESAPEAAYSNLRNLVGKIQKKAAL